MSKTTCIVLAFLCLFSACSEKLVCPAYQSSFILDNRYREKYFSPFEVANGDTVPKGKFKIQKEQSDFFLAKAFTSPEQPVLENPYLLARVFKKRPYWKLDRILPEIIYYDNTETIRYSNEALIDSVKTDLPVEYVLTLPIRNPPHNVEQANYNKKFGHLFPQPKRPEEETLEEDDLDAFMADTISTDSVANKKGVLGIFKKKAKEPKPKKEKNKKGEDNNSKGVLEDEIGL